MNPTKSRSKSVLISSVNNTPFSRDGNLFSRLSAFSKNEGLKIDGLSFRLTRKISSQRKYGSTFVRLFHSQKQKLGVQKVGNTYKFQERRVVAYNTAVVYKAVADVSSYQDFLPWVTQSRVIQKISPYELLAELDVGFNFFSERYTSRVKLSHDCEKFSKDLEYSVKASAEDSPLFNELVTDWTIYDNPKHTNSSKLAISISFEFRSRLHDAVAEMFIEKVVETMVDSFLSRCKYVEENDMSLTYSTGLPTSEMNGSKDSASKTSVNNVDLTLLELESLSHFSRVELKRVKDRFDRALRKQGDGEFTLKQDSFVDLFMDLFYWSPNSKIDDDSSLKKISRSVLVAIARHQFNALDLNNDGVVDLREFVAGMSIMLKGTALEKCRLWFRCYDLDRDGLLSREELEQLLKASVAVKTALIIAVKANSGTVLQPKEFSSNLIQENEKLVSDVLNQSFGNFPFERKFSLREIEVNLLSEQNDLFSIE